MAIKDTGLNVVGLQAAFFDRFDGTPVYFSDLTMRVESTKDKESYRWLGQVPQMREWGTGRVTKGLSIESYDVTNLKYEVSLEVDRDEIDDDQTGQIRIRVQELAVRAATHKDFLGGELLKNGEAAGFNAYDGKTFFATDHVSGASGAQSNKLDFDISAVLPSEPDTPDAPSIPTVRKAFAQVVAQMVRYKDEQGEPQRMRPTGLVVCCHPANAQIFNDALNAGIIDNTSVQPVIGKPTMVIPFPEFTDESKFYVLKTDGVDRVQSGGHAAGQRRAATS